MPRKKEVAGRCGQLGAFSKGKGDGLTADDQECGEGEG
jgi:hypothetical protein